MRRSILSALALSLVAALAPSAQAAPDAPRRYIVVLKDSVSSPGSVASSHAREHGARVTYVYTHALKGYSAAMSETAARRIGHDSRVSYVELDGVVTKSTDQAPVTWGLNRIDDRALPMDGNYSYATTGAGVTAYIIDSGVTATTTEFGDRVSSGYDAIDGGDATDCDGHGTHVAGTVGSSTYGVAKGVDLVAVRVLDCNGSGTWSGVIAGVDWVTGVHAAGAPAVANMSLGGGASSAVDDAVTKSIADGVTYAVAAGNGNKAGQAQDACNYSPARIPNALTTGATDKTDTKASWSNYGTCLDLFAPGVGITSTTQEGGTATWSGTSMASPHVAGVVALYLETSPTASPAEVATVITSRATPNLVLNEGTGSPDLLLFSLLTAPTEPAPGNTAPSVSVTAPVAGSTVSGTVPVSATATDSDGSVQEVEFFLGAAGTPFHSDTNAADGWGFDWDSTSVANGAHTITALATDDAGATGSASVSVTVSNGDSSTSITLETSAKKVKGVMSATLTWAGATGSSVEVWRNGSKLPSATANDGSYTDTMGKGSGTFTYKVCEVGSLTACSNDSTVVF